MVLTSKTRCARLALFFIVSLLAEGTPAPRRLWSWAHRQAKYEQTIEDSNTPFKIQSLLVRDLIVLPITDEFAGGSQHPLHGKLQCSDKCSFPSSIGRDIFRRPYEVPWIFEISKVSSRRKYPKANSTALVTSDAAYPLERIYVSPLDFRAPENYIYIPQWAMLALGVQPEDRVRARFIRLQLSSKVILQPLNITWDTKFMRSRIENGARRDPTHVLEQQLNKYSALTAGSVIRLDIEGHEYSFLVKETFGETGASVYGVRVQDADVSVEIDRSALDLINQPSSQQ